MAARRESQRLRRSARRRDEAEHETRDAGEEAQSDEAKERDDSARDGSGGGVFAELKNIASDAALAVLAPVAKQAATKAAKFAVKKGPELMEDKILPKLDDVGGPAGLLDAVKGGGDSGDGGDAGDGTGKGRRMPIQQAVDVAAPIDIVYDQFTQFEDFPKFMHRVERVEQKDDAHVEFHEKVWGFRRQWEAEIVEQRPDERIVWESESGLEHVGVVTFHELSERLTRIELNIDIDPSGPIEKIARGARFAKRAARADLKRFKAYVEMHEDATGAWLGEIEDGEVVSDDDAYYEDEEEREEEPEAQQDEPDEEEDKPKRRQPSRSRGGSSNGSSKSKAAAPKGRSRSGSRGSKRSSNGSSKSGSRAKASSAGKGGRKR